MDKIFLSADQLLEDAFTLGMSVIDSGYRPDFLVAIWRGGTPVGIAIQELLAYFDIPNEHQTLRTRHYTGIDQRLPSVQVDGLEPVLDKITANSRVLIVDDVYDTGLSAREVVAAIENAFVDPPEVRVATIYYKPDHNKSGRAPDYYLHVTSAWLVFPHELMGLSTGEILNDKPGATTLKQHIDAGRRQTD
jgi:hypothetical protein